MTISEGAWDETCTEKKDGHGVALSYSDGSVKDPGTIGSGALNIKGCSPAYSHREHPWTHVLSSDRVGLLHTPRCLNTIRSNDWEGAIQHRVGNMRVVKRYQHLGRGFQATTTAGTDLWVAMGTY